MNPIQYLRSQLWTTSSKIGYIFVGIAVFAFLFGPTLAALWAPVDRYTNIVDALEKAEMLLFGTGILGFLMPDKKVDE